MLLRSRAMTGGYGSEFDPVRLDWDEHLSEGETDDCTFVTTRSSFNPEDAVDDDCYIVPSCPGKTEAAFGSGKMEVTPSPPVRMEITPSPPVKMEVNASPPVKMEVNASPPVKMEVNASPPVKMEVNASPPMKMEVNASPPVKMEVSSSQPVKMEVTMSPPVKMEAALSPPVRAEIAEPSTTVTLTPEQQQVLDFVQAGKNVFFSGPGGTGKTVVLREIVEFFKWRFDKHHSDYLHLGHTCGCFACNVAITAPTGIAAIPIGGSTLHRATGIGIPRRPRDFNRMWDKPIRLKWRNLSVLIIDEISMVSAELLEYLEQTIRRIRTKKVNLPGEPFGGLQVIIAGDFFQLQPVEDKDTKTCSNQFLNRGLAFEAPAWDRANLKTVILKRVFRQKDDHFVALLNGIRTGENKAALEEIVENCSRPLPVKNGIQPTVLYPRNVEVDQFNKQKLNGLMSREVVINADEEILTEEGLKAVEERNEDLRRVQERILIDAEFWKDCIAPDQVKLKVGAQVMLLRNLDQKGNENDLVNGSRGILVGWKSKEKVLNECFVDQSGCAEILRNRPETNEERRVRIRVEQKIVNLNNSSIDPIPIVRFRNERLIDCVPEKFSYEFLNVGECIRWQVPLKLAWALTIHKCQGMTLDYVVVNLQDIFAEGQVYVALSRARSMAGLQVVGNCSAKDVRVSQKVIEFYKALAANEVPSVGKFLFPDMEFEIPPEEMMANARRKIDGRIVNGTSISARAEKLFERCPREILSKPVVCYHCKKEGHPAFKCKLGPLLIINA
ncbi:hypothetical protein M758_8G159100 [Ceratodon purpureus]|nr:hypothetical protein M758_8G159100 [Ceratodon purpureus]